MKCSSSRSLLLPAIYLIFVASAVLGADDDVEAETTTESYLIIPTTLQPSSGESWESSYKNDFGVPESNPQLPQESLNKSTPVPVRISSSSATEPAPDVAAPAFVGFVPVRHPVPSMKPAVPPVPVPLEADNPPSPTVVFDAQSPQVYSFKVDSSIKYRYSRTHITSRVVNPNQRNAQEIRFSIILPEMAFISRFAMEIDGMLYESYVKEKDEAKKIYNQAQSQGQSAGLVEVNARNTNTFNVNVNIHPGSKINFNLTYEELLERRVGVYEHSINVLPEQLNVKDFQIRVDIEESQNITLLRVPDAEKESEELAGVVIERPAGNQAVITWAPGQEFKALAKFTVNYDLVRELDSGQVLVNNGYFVHFFSPANLPPLRKHVVFILDTSGSMWGRRIEQLKDAMGKILQDLKSDDFFNIITFASDVVVWDPADVVPISPNSHWTPPGTEIKKAYAISRKTAYPASSFNIERAQNYIKSLVASGGTNIHDAVVQGLNLTSAIRAKRDEVNGTAAAAVSAANVTAALAKELNTTEPSQALPPHVESIIIFLTDGEPTVGITNPVSIQALVKQSNMAKIPIFSLGFGDGADFPFLRRLSLQNNGFARKIYAEADAALQLKGFYNEIASPLLSNVTFNYTSADYSIENVTISKYVTVFGGGEVVIAGKISGKPDKSRFGIGAGEIPVGETRAFVVPSPPALPVSHLEVMINGYGRDGAVKFTAPEIYSVVPGPGGAAPFPPRPTPPPTQEDWFLERLWAYLTIRQLIDEDLSKEMESNEIESVPVTTTTVASVSAVAPVGVTGSIPRNVTIRVPETPKQRATRLALKYGFVTPLTSLVVVKPNSTDVTDSVSSNAPSKEDEEAISAGGIKRVSVASFAAPIPLSVASFAAPIPLSVNHAHFASPPRIVLLAHRPSTLPPIMQGFLAGGRPVFHSTLRPTHVYPAGVTATSITPVAGEEIQPSTSTAFVRPHTPMVTLGTAAPTPEHMPDIADIPETTQASTASNPLESLTWYSKGALVVVNQTDYRILEAGNDSSLVQNATECMIATNGQNLSGKCQHLRDCVQDQFRNDFDLYVKTYFCPVDVGNSVYAGVCCTPDAMPRIAEDVLVTDDEYEII